MDLENLVLNDGEIILSGEDITSFADSNPLIYQGEYGNINWANMVDGKLGNYQASEILPTLNQNDLGLLIERLCINSRVHYLNNFIKTYTPQITTIFTQEDVLDFEARNPTIWIGPGHGSLERCESPIMGDVDLNLVLYLLSGPLKQAFWNILFRIIHPDLKKEEFIRHLQLVEAVANFKQDLESIGIDIDPLELIHDKKMAIENGLVALFDIKIDKANQEAFLNHATKVWNLANPYDQIKKSNGLVLQLKNVMGDIFSTVKSSIESSDSAPEDPFGTMGAMIGNMVPNLYQTLNNASPQEQQKVVDEALSLFAKMMEKFTSGNKI